VPIDEAEARERLAHDDNLEVRLRAGRHAVISALILDLEVRRSERIAEEGFDALGSCHSACLGRLRPRGKWSSPSAV
jgi:hypothetical protein